MKKFIIFRSSTWQKNKFYPKVHKYWTPKHINFPFVLNGKLMDFRCPNIQAHHNYAVICLNCGTPKKINFPFGTNGKLIILGVPILKLITVSSQCLSTLWLDSKSTS